MNISKQLFQENIIKPIKRQAQNLIPPVWAATLNRTKVSSSVRHLGGTEKPKFSHFFFWGGGWVIDDDNI